MEFDHDAWPLGQGQGSESDAFHGRLDWHGLRARFLAAHSYRQAIGTAASRANGAIGASFDRSAARVLAQFEDASHDVNLNNSADRKGRFGMGEDVAGTPQPGVARPGDRG